MMATSVHGAERPSVTVPCAGFSVRDTLNSGQCFRWVERNGRMCGTAFGRYIEVVQNGDSMTIVGTDDDDYAAVWRGYFDMDRDYDAIRKTVTELEPRLCDAADYAAGVHVLGQDPWEALCSFVISQNNNIPRIRGIVRKLCLHCGERAVGWAYAADPADAMAFPTATALAEVSEATFREWGCGYRAAYLTELSRAAEAGSIDFDFIRTAPIDAARKQLRSLKGIGPKVAECVLLYGFGRMECFPVDVWIRRALETELTGGTALIGSEYAGIGQQYLFEYIRQHPEKFVRKS